MQRTLRSHLAVVATGLMVSLSGFASGAEAVLELQVRTGVIMRNGKPMPATPLKDRFGTGQDGVTIGDLRYTCDAIPEGDYILGQAALGGAFGGYFTFGEFFTERLKLYLNDTRLEWTGYTEPVRPETASDQKQYQAEMRVGKPVHVKPGDVLRVVAEGSGITVGPLRLYRDNPGDEVALLEGAGGTVQPTAGWQGDWIVTNGWVHQTAWIENGGVLPIKVELKMEAVSYLQSVLAVSNETVTLQAGERISRTFRFQPKAGERSRLMLTLSGPALQAPLRAARFYAPDRVEGPRPNTCLNGPWEMCFVPGVEPGATPPAGAVWTPVTVPSLQPISKGHCAWYRKVIAAPAAIRGERILLSFAQVLCEAWITVNGRPIAHVRHGSLPFEVDITQAFKPGASNEIQVAVRDWLAYSPKNRERVLGGQPPTYKDDMIDTADYDAAEKLGIGGPVWLEARPAVSVDDVFVATSVREKRLTLRYRLANAGPEEQQVDLNAEILDQGNAIRALRQPAIRIAAGGTTNVTLTMAWKHPRLWQPGDPYLYALRTTLIPAAGAADRHVQRFGFRELWIDGFHFVFNGTVVKLPGGCAGGTHGSGGAMDQVQPGRRLEGSCRRQLEALRYTPRQITRIGLRGAASEAMEIADETGLLLKPEADIQQVKFTADETFWNAALASAVRMVEAHKNHASVVAWSAGNENMWGLIYQGDESKRISNEWQVRIAQAMRAADLQRRPIEWEADGDLMGRWEYHALHYPRELNGAPDVPNGAWWGPLDGKTVVRYSMGPITLGQKPLTVGESFWPATLGHPYGQTIILGDEAYLGGQAQWKGWIQSSSFFINGFRDVEFALTDTYTPMSLQPPQTVVLKQETAAFYGGRTLRRDVNVHNDVGQAAKLVVRWSLGEPGRKPMAVGRQAFKLAAGERRRTVLEVRLPAVETPVSARFRVELLQDGRVLNAQERAWRIAPAPALRVPAGLDLAVYDPQGEAAALLTATHVPFTRLTGPQPLTGRMLVLGRDALSGTAQNTWVEPLAAFVRAGGKVLVLEQSEAPECLPMTLTQARKPSTLTFARAADHPAMAGLDDADLRWWADDHYVSSSNYRKPQHGNWLPLIDAGTADGLLETPLLELYLGRGSFLLCQMPVVGKFGSAPPAARLLQNLLDYLAAPGCFRTPGRTALLTRNAKLRAALQDSRLVSEDLAERPDALTADSFAVAIADAQALRDNSLAGTLLAYARAGGHLLIHGATPADQAALESRLGLRLRFFPVHSEPTDIRNRALRRGNAGLLAGISNHEFFWASGAYLACLRQEGCWWSGYKGSPPEEFIASYFCRPADDADGKAVRLTRPNTLLQVPVGRGYVLLNQLRFDEPVRDTEPTVKRLRSLLLTNLGCTLRGEARALRARKDRLRQYTFFPVDLSPFVNRSFKDDTEHGIAGWSNQGKYDMRDVPSGRQEWGGVPFLIAAPKSVITLYSRSAGNMSQPKEVTGIPIGRKADALFFVHATAWTGSTNFIYRVHYDDGAVTNITIIGNKHVVDWVGSPARITEAMMDEGMFVAWQGIQPVFNLPVILPGYEWQNPFPQKAIRSVDFLVVPGGYCEPVPMLVAITAAQRRADQGVVTGVTGTHGLKVKLGSGEITVRYIGCAGIDPEHPFHDRAVAAHRALAEGQPVTIQYDVVPRNEAGEALAYVYLGVDALDENHLLNAKVIGEGLGKLGSFEGNDRYRMFLENLGFIAGQRKAGMWTEKKPGAP